MCSPSPSKSDTRMRDRTDLNGLEAPTGPYASAARSVCKAGYSPLPVEFGTKSGFIPEGYTGYDGKDASQMDIQVWIEERGADNIAARLPVNVVGLDVDAYEGKVGAKTLAGLEAEVGSLPLTFRISARFGDGYDGSSGIRLFRLPQAYEELARQRVWRSEWHDIQIIRFAHRYLMAPPSVHPDIGKPYRVLNEDTDEFTDSLPNVDDIPVLPNEWCEQLRNGRPERPRTEVSESQFWTEGKPCRAVLAALDQSRLHLAAQRHDGMRDGLLRLTRMGEQGHHGTHRAIDVLHEVFLEAASEPGPGRRSAQAARAEWGRAVSRLDAIIMEEGLTENADRGCCGTSAAVDGDNPDATFRRDVLSEVRRLEVRAAARREYSELHAPEAQPFDAGLLTELMERPEQLSWRIEGVHAADGVLLVVAHRKAGKTTLLLNLARSYLTGERFLGEFDVTPIEGRVALLNYEVSSPQITRWASQAGVPADRLFVVNLRGRLNPLASESEVQRLRELLQQKQVEVLMVDPFARAFAGVGENSNDSTQVNAFTGLLDRLAYDAGCSEIVLTNHTGWNTDRGRNSTALEDWPDAILTMIKDKSNESRFLSAIGRDVDVEQDLLEYDPGTRLLRLTGAGGIKVAKMAANQEALIEEIVKIVAREPGVDNTDLGAALKLAGLNFQRGDESKAAREAHERGLIVRRKSGRRQCHFPAEG